MATEGKVGLLIMAVVIALVGSGLGWDALAFVAAPAMLIAVVGFFMWLHGREPAQMVISAEEEAGQ